MSSSDNLFANVLQNQDSETQTETDTPKVDELTMLKQRATLMGIKFSGNLKDPEILRAKIKAKLDGEAQPADDEDETDENQEAENEDFDPTPNAHPLDHDGDGKPGGSVSNEQVAAAKAKEEEKPARKLSKAELKMQMRQKLMKEQLKLVRVRITNLDPKKKDLPGEIFTVGNKYIGTIRKFIPYGEVTDNGYHIPYVLYQELKGREFLSIKTRKGKNGTPIVETQYVREFALEVLPQLTAKELAELKAAQSAAGRD